MAESAKVAQAERQPTAPSPADYAPEQAACSPGTRIDAPALADELTGELERLSRERERDPISNPVLRLAHEISERVKDGRLDYAALEQLVQYLTVEGFRSRAARLRRYLGELDPAANETRLREVFRTLARPRTPAEAGNDRADLVRFELFKQRVEHESFGIVITAHPTFNLSTPLMRALADLATGFDGTGRPLGAAERDRIEDLARRSEHRPDADISLAREHALSMEAIANILAGLRRAYDLLFQVAAELYPRRWTELKPRIVTVASWVGYDLDGRSDIRWTDTLSKRLLIQERQLEHYMEEVRALRAKTGRRSQDLREILDLMESRLALALSQISEEVAVFGMAESERSGAVSALSRRMFENRALRLSDSGLLIGMTDRAIERARDPEVVRRLCVLRAELANHGLGMAHTHVRINATQVHNAIRKTVGLVTPPNDPRYRVSYLEKLDALLDRVEPVSVNFGSVLRERTTVKRLFMVIAQMLKYSDRTAPIRFLIAECESAFTALTALYYARMFGVDDKVDISPLFETEKALEAGSRVVDQLLENRHYRAYVRRRGRICIQTGYSDAGRYLGQAPASASIERLRLRLVRVMAKHGLTDVQLVIFDTHGESIGRGGHPAGFEQRLAYVDTPASRGFMDEQGVAFKQEVSFQGGDGYLYFVNPVSAFAVVSRILEHTLRHGDNSGDDPFYDEAPYIREFFTTVKEFQVRLMEDPNYGVLLSAFGANLLFQSGSRAFRREHEDATEHEAAPASQIRAIPHNAILQQLGLLANSVGGVGAAIDKDPEKFRGLYRRSARLRQLIGIVEYGEAVSCPDAMKAYIDTLDPGFWIVRAAAEKDPERRRDMLALAGYLDQPALHERQSRIFRRLYQDFTMLRAALETRPAPEGGFGGAPMADERTRLALVLLHAIRVAIIHEIYLLAMRIPEFASRQNITVRQLVMRLVHLDAPSVIRLLEEIFPMTEASSGDEDFGEPATYRGDDAQSYTFENERIFRPILGLSILVRRISTAVIHRIGFLG